ncbi:MAG: hypothetical protein IJM39_08435 [Firmicutes bacterium]|nr:hypothetical protein [Bacillota bacterium]
MDSRSVAILRNLAAIKNYVGTVGNIVVAVTTAIALYRESKKAAEKTDAAQEQEEPGND